MLLSCVIKSIGITNNVCTRNAAYTLRLFVYIIASDDAFKPIPFQSGEASGTDRININAAGDVPLYDRRTGNAGRAWIYKRLIVIASIGRGTNTNAGRRNGN